MNRSRSSLNTFAIATLMLATTGCTSGNQARNSHLCRPVQFHCDDYRSKYLPTAYAPSPAITCDDYPLKRCPCAYCRPTGCQIDDYCVKPIPQTCLRISRSSAPGESCGESF